MIAGHDLTALCSRLSRALARPRGSYRPLRIDGSAAGWLDDARSARIATMRDVFVVRDDSICFVEGLDTEERRSAALERVARELSEAGELTAWRDERYDVAPEFGAAPWFRLERAAARYFGIHTYAAHLNGVVRGEDGILMWLARRSATKSIDPGMLDNLVGGGVASGQSVNAALMKESWEEAGIPVPLARLAKAAGHVEIWREQPDGLQHETIFVHDLWLPATFTPVAQDAEVVDYRLVTLAEVAKLVAVGKVFDAITADASLVIVDFLMRQGKIERDTTTYRMLDALRHPPTSFATPAS